MEPQKHEMSRLNSRLNILQVYMKGILTQTYSVSHSHITSPKPVRILTPLRRNVYKTHNFSSMLGAALAGGVVVLRAAGQL